MDNINDFELISNIDEFDNDFNEEFEENDITNHFVNTEFLHSSHIKRKTFKLLEIGFYYRTYNVEPKREFNFAGVSYCSKDELKAILVKLRIFLHYLWLNKSINLYDFTGNIKVNLYYLYLNNYLYSFFKRVENKQLKVKVINPSITSDNISNSNRKLKRWNITKDKVDNATFWYKKNKIANNDYLEIFNFLNEDLCNINREDHSFYLYQDLLRMNQVIEIFNYIDKMNKKNLGNIENNMVILDFLFRDFEPRDVLVNNDYRMIKLRYNTTFSEEFARKFGKMEFIMNKLSYNLEHYEEQFTYELSRFELEPDFAGVMSYYIQNV